MFFGCQPCRKINEIPVLSYSVNRRVIGSIPCGMYRPGRDGQWSGFLRERGIPHATADKLVLRHQRLLNSEVNCASESTSEPTDEEVRKLFNSLWPKLHRVLRTPSSFYHFVSLLTSQYEGSETTDRRPTNLPASSDSLIIAPELGAAVVACEDEFTGSDPVVSDDGGWDLDCQGMEVPAFQTKENSYSSGKP
jgi:hypothetical protein